MNEFSAMSQDFVEATSALVRGRTINIMDKNAIIIASTEKERIGNYHQGAAEVIATGKPVLIEKEDLTRYPGAREGYNMPIFLENELIGVVGLFGCGQEVADVANLLKVYVTQQFSQQTMAKRQNMDSEVRSQLLHLLLLGDSDQVETISQLSSLLSVQLVYPVHVMLLRAPADEMTREHWNHFTELFQNLLWQGALSRKHDIYGIQDNQYVILHSRGDGSNREFGSLDKILAAIRQEKRYRLTVSGPCSCLAKLPTGMKEASALMSMNTADICSMEENEVKIDYLMYKSLLHGGSTYAKALYDRLSQTQDEQQIQTLLQTAILYYQENSSVQKAADRLHIHKNTLLYRMKHLFELLGLENETPFAREFFIRLILTSHPAEE